MAGETNSSSSGEEFDFEMADEQFGSSAEDVLAPTTPTTEWVYQHPELNQEVGGNEWAGQPNQTD